MTETTTLREVALAESINGPDATFEEHLDFLIEIALDLEMTGDPDAVISDADATRVLEVAALEIDGDDNGDAQADRDRADLGDPDWAYESYLEASFDD